MSRRRSIWLLPVVGLLIAGCATTGSGQTSPSHGGSSVGVGVGGGSGGVGVSSGVRVSPGTDPVLNSTLTGAAIGSLGGPIGLGIGAVLGYVHGLAERDRLEKLAKAEADRQAQIDKELEWQIEAKRNRPAATGMEGSTGLILVEDHVKPEREIAASPPATTPSEGEGLIQVTDHLGPAPPPEKPITAHAPGSSPTAATTAGVGSEERNEVTETREQIAAARQRQQELLEAIQGTATTSEASGAGGSPMKESPPPIDREGFRLVHAEGGLVRKERDVNGDGKPDTIRHYDPTGRLLRQEEDSRLDGRLDTWTFYEDGHPARKESDTNGDGTVDLWAFYDGPDDLVRTEADTDHDGHRDRVVLYAQGEMVEEQHYSPGLNPPRLRITYAKGEPTRKDEDTNRDGRTDRVTEYDEAGRVTKVSRNPTDDGTFTLFAYYQPKTEAVLREEEDLDGDGGIDVISYYEEARLVRREFFDLPEVASLKPPLSLPQAPPEGKTP